MTSTSQTQESKCPFSHGSNTKIGGNRTRSDDWWPNQLNIKILHQHDKKSNPMGEDFDYQQAFKSLSLSDVKKDIEALLKDSKPWWPADYGHYGPFMIRMAWHAAGTYREGDGRGGASTGNQRFAPLNSWPDNGNLDKARRLLWPVKQKYGSSLSWADLFILTGNVALDSMGLKTIGFGGGREDIWAPEEDIYWGVEKEWLDNQRYSGERNLDKPLAAVQMGLIYVNPEGPDGVPDPKASAVDIRETFKRMGMNDYETVALTAGGHTFGKAHGAAGEKYLSDEPEAAPIEQMGLGWKNSYETGKGPDTITSGIEGAWTPTPTTWDMSYFDLLFGYEWELTTSPAGAKQWKAIDLAKKDHAPSVDDHEDTLPVMMTTADMAMKEDAAYQKISRHFQKNPEEFAQAFAEAWFKLTHRDMGPKTRYLGDDVPDEDFIWQDPLPANDHNIIDENQIDSLKEALGASDLSIYDMVYTAWSSASTFRTSDRRGGANGARIRLSPQKDWDVNQPIELERVLEKLEEIRVKFNQAEGKNTPVSMADLIVLAGGYGIEQAALATGDMIKVPFIPGRTDATQEQTDQESFAVLEPAADGFRNYKKDAKLPSTEELLIDKSQLLGLTAPEMAVIIGGFRSMGINYNKTDYGTFNSSNNKLDNSFFKSLTDMSITWEPRDSDSEYFVGTDTANNTNYNASRADLVFGSNSQLRTISEVYAQDDSREKFLNDFVTAWNKVMNADRFDLFA